jgi:hypothetical protein
MPSIPARVEAQSMSMIPSSPSPPKSTSNNNQYDFDGFKDTLAEKEEAFFTALYKDPNLQLNHPLKYLVNAKLQLAQSNVDKLKSSLSAPQLSNNSSIFSALSDGMNPEDIEYDDGRGGHVIRGKGGHSNPYKYNQGLSREEEIKERKRKKKKALEAQEREKTRRQRATRHPATKLAKVYDNAIESSNQAIKRITSHKKGSNADAHREYLSLTLNQVKDQLQMDSDLLRTPELFPHVSSRETTITGSPNNQQSGTTNKGGTSGRPVYKGGHRLEGKSLLISICEQTHPDYLLTVEGLDLAHANVYHTTLGLGDLSEVAPICGLSSVLPLGLSTELRTLWFKTLANHLNFSIPGPLNLNPINQVKDKNKPETEADSIIS